MRKNGPYVLLAVFALLVIVAAVWLRTPKTAPHSVTLTWQAPAPRSGVRLVGYNVYRRTAEGGSFIKIADKVSGAPYEDRMISSGRTYFYIVTSVDSLGRESRFSTSATAEIP